MFLSLIIAVLIGCYVFFVLHRKIKDIKEGRYCGGSCEGCLKHCSDRKESMDT